MQIKKSFFFLAIASVLTVSALPVKVDDGVSVAGAGADMGLAIRDIHALKKRCHTKKPHSPATTTTSAPLSMPTVCEVEITSVDLLSAKVAAAIHAKIDAAIFLDFFASLEETLEAEIDISIKALGCMINLENLDLKLVKKKSIAALKTKFQAKFQAAIDARFGAELKIQLVQEISSVSKDCIAKEELQKIIVEILADLKAELKIELPLIAASLKTYIGSELDIGVRKLAIEIPWLLRLDVTTNFDLDVDLELAASAAVKACVELDVEVLAEIIVQHIVI